MHAGGKENGGGSKRNTDFVNLHGLLGLGSDDKTEHFLSLKFLGILG
jgi:hypothetical protein